VGDHASCFGRDQTVFDPWHYVPVLARKPGALRNGAPFKGWVLPAFEATCQEALREGVHSADVVINILRGAVNLRLQPPSLLRTRCGCVTRRWPTAPA
jgi:hypothetical protein